MTRMNASCSHFLANRRGLLWGLALLVWALLFLPAVSQASEEGHDHGQGVQHAAAHDHLKDAASAPAAHCPEMEAHAPSAHQPPAWGQSSRSALPDGATMACCAFHGKGEMDSAPRSDSRLSSLTANRLSIPLPPMPAIRAGSRHESVHAPPPLLRTARLLI